MCERNPIQCIIPPYVMERLANSGNAKVREYALNNLSVAAGFRAIRRNSRLMPAFMAAMSPNHGKHRLVYDANHHDSLPGTLLRSENQGPSADPSVNEAFDGAGHTYDFYSSLFNRNSLDDNGMSLISTVHYAEPDFNGNLIPMNNAFWNGRQMAYGDGDGIVFQRFTRSLDVIAHELTHGVQSFTSNLTYRGESGALNEHFADVFGVLVRQWVLRDAEPAPNWLIGADILVPAPTRRALRDMENPGTAFTNDPELGTDPQPAHMSQMYTGTGDRGGVHINSGIPNRAFVLTAQALGGHAWEVAGRIWYEAMLQLSSSSKFVDCAKMTLQIASSPPFGGAAAPAVRSAWEAVGIALE